MEFIGTWVGSATRMELQLKERYNHLGFSNILEFLFEDVCTAV